MASVTLVHQGNPMRMRELHSKPLRTYNTPSGRVSLRCVYIHICRYISVFLWLCVWKVYTSVCICMCKSAADAIRAQANKPDLLSSSTCLKSHIVGYTNLLLAIHLGALLACTLHHVRRSKTEDVLLQGQRWGDCLFGVSVGCCKIPHHCR